MKSNTNNRTKISKSRSGETVDNIVSLIKDQILDGRLAPGQRLISTDLVEQLGVSRGPLREAFRQLDAEGLIDVEPNRGAIVRRLGADEVKNLYEIRIALEGFAARLAAEKINEGDNRAFLEDVLHRGRRHRKDPVFSAFVNDNREFHQAIVHLCGNPELGKLIDKYQQPVFMIQLRQIIGTSQVIAHALDEHEKIAEGILSGSPEAAYLAMREHLIHSSEQILNSPALINPKHGSKSWA
ncbi:MAG TPA: GntR family transcriptional regulator [Alcaligenaceae bacterium]|nr:GntR family transcriptional regulator [Alcaligenaceae bacterium]